MIPFTDFGGAGPLLHFAHANAYPPGAYWPFLTALTAHYQVRAMHQRPLWSGQDAQQLTDWHLFGADLIDFFDQYEMRQVVGVGHSLGAVAMLYAAVVRPELFRALVLVEPVFLPPHILALAQANPGAADEMPLVKAARRRRHRWPDRQAAFDRYRTKAVFARMSDAALWTFVQAGVQEAADGAYVLAFPREWEAAIYAHPPADVWELVGQVTQPTLAIRAAESDTILPAPWRLWQEKQPAATFMEIADSSHLLPLEKPYELARQVLGWLGQLESGEKPL